MKQEVIDKLKEMKTSLAALREKHHSTSEEEFESIRSLLMRIIDRTYPEKDAKELKEKLQHKCWIITGNETDAYWQKFHTDKIDLSLRMIDTILQEYSLFGDDFTPVKEKVESEIGINQGKFSLFKRKTKEK